MKPYIISHMYTSVDGRIDCDMTEQLDPSDIYYEALDRLACPSCLMGRVTMQRHYADSEPYAVADATPIGRTAFHQALAATGYTVAVDTLGRLAWSTDVIDGQPLLVLTSERCPEERLNALTAQGISWIAVGREAIDLPQAMEILGKEFSVTRLALLGGGHINGAFLAEGLIDEVSIMLGAGIDGRAGQPCVFDGLGPDDRPATLLKLQSIEHVNDRTLWLRYAMA